MKHIAILRQPFLNMIMSGEKTIESRWSMKKIVPYNKLKKDDLIYFKETGKDVSATARVLDVKYYELTPKIAEEIRIKYGKQIGTDKFEDWNEEKNKKYCTLIWLKDVTKIAPMKVKRSNGAGWLIVE